MQVSDLWSDRWSPQVRVSAAGQHQLSGISQVIHGAVVSVVEIMKHITDWELMMWQFLLKTSF